MTTWADQWNDERIAREQAALVARQLSAWQGVPHFMAFAAAVRATGCPGTVLEVGCGPGHGRDILRLGKVEVSRYHGIDVSGPAIDIAKARNPDDQWTARRLDDLVVPLRSEDIVIDGSCLLHVEDWKGHLERLCGISRRWVILHRVPIAGGTVRWKTSGYGRTFDAWEFSRDDVETEMRGHGFQLVQTMPADGGSSTMVFARPRHFASYCDGAYLSRLRALHSSLVKYAGPFELHVLAWDAVAWDGYSRISKGRYGALHVDEFLGRHPELRPENLPGPARTRVEHMWTVGPAWVASVMEETGEPVCYLDADLLAFSSLEPMFAEIGGAPAGFVGHNFAPKAAGLPGPTVESHARAFGALNVGAAYFADPAIAARWAELVRGHCYDRPDLSPDGRIRYADQKYLEWLVDEFPGIHVVKDPAAHVGPWNIHACKMHKRGEAVYFGDKPLALYHFSALKLGPHGQDQLSRPEYGITDEQAAILYSDYIAELRR